MPRKPHSMTLRLRSDPKHLSPSPQALPLHQGWNQRHLLVQQLSSTEKGPEAATLRSEWVGTPQL